MTVRSTSHLDHLDEWARQLYSAVVSDACDNVMIRDRTARSGLRPVADQQRVLVGFARPVRAAPVNAIPEQPYAPEVSYVDSLEPGDVVVASTSGSAWGFWGELFSTAATGRGARGAVIDGLVRDQLKIAELGFPVFATGARPADSLGRLSIVEQDEPVDLRGVRVERGDLVVADIDGITVVPKALIGSVIPYAIDKANTENQVRAQLLKGAKLADVWERYRVL
jgi:4-hydroxy-4-methyl-2-oxoglutarate aldolase